MPSGVGTHNRRRFMHHADLLASATVGLVLLAALLAAGASDGAPVRRLPTPAPTHPLRGWLAAPPDQPMNSGMDQTSPKGTAAAVPLPRRSVLQAAPAVPVPALVPPLPAPPVGAVGPPGDEAIGGPGSSSSSSSNATRSPALTPPSVPWETPEERSPVDGAGPHSDGPSRNSTGQEPPGSPPADEANPGKLDLGLEPAQPPSGLQDEAIGARDTSPLLPPPDAPPPDAPAPGAADGALRTEPSPGGSGSPSAATTPPDASGSSGAPPNASDSAAPPGGETSGSGMNVTYVDRHVTDTAGLVAAMEELTRNLTAAGAGAAATAAGAGSEALRGRIFLAPGVYDMAAVGPLRVVLGLELVGGRLAAEAAAAAALEAEDGAGAVAPAAEAVAPSAASGSPPAADADTHATADDDNNSTTAGAPRRPVAGAVASHSSDTRLEPPAAAFDAAGRRALAHRRLLQAAAARPHNGRTILDCGDSGEGALTMTHGGFVLRDLVFTRCGGAAPVLVDFGTGRSSSSSSSSSGGGGGVSGGSSITGSDGGSLPPGPGLLEGCAFEGNAGTVAGAVAVQPGAQYAPVNLRLVGCVFRNNSGRETPGDYVYDYDYSTGVAQRPVVPASVLALGRGSHRISGCVFEGNAPMPAAEASGNQQAWYNASAASAAVDLSCWQGPASLHIEDSVFTGNTGRESGAIYLHGHSDGETPSLGCDLVLRRVTLARNGGHQAAALLASCPVKGSNCELTLKHTAVVGNRTPQSGAMLLRGSGMVFTADNLTLAHNVGGGLGYVDVGTTVTNSRIENNTATGFGGVSGWGGYFDATNTSFVANGPTTAGARRRPKASANVLSNSYGNKLVNCTFEANRGHALYVYAADIVIRNCRFLHNVFVPGARNSNGGALMLFDLVLLSSIESTLFERNVAVVGGAVMLYSSQKLRIAGCTFRSNSALSGGGITIDVPVADIEVANSTFVNNVAVGTAEELLAAAGINVTASSAAATPSPTVAVAAVAAPLPPIAPGAAALAPQPPVPPMLHAPSPLLPANNDYGSDTDAAASAAADYGSSSSSSSGAGARAGDVATSSIVAPPESCGAGGGGGLCVRGSQDVPVSLANVSLHSNTALLGGGLYVGVSSRCLRLVACYRLRLDERVSVTGNRALMAGGAVYWEHERILQLACSGGNSRSSGSGSTSVEQSSAGSGSAAGEAGATDQLEQQTSARLRLAPPAWPGLLRQLQTHTFAPLATSAGTLAVANTSTRYQQTGISTSSSRSGDSGSPWAPPAPSSAAAPGYNSTGTTSASTTSAGTSTSTSANAGLLTGTAAVRAYLRRVTPCALWANNTVGEGGYGPTIASTVFFHQPLLLPTAAAAASRSPATATLPLPAPQQQPQPKLAVATARRRSLRQLLQLAGSTAAAAVAAVAPPLGFRPPPPLPPPQAPPAPMFESGAALPVVVHVFDFYGQKVTRSVIDSSVLIMCTSLNALGQKAAQAEAGTADFSQLRLRDQVNASYELQFEGRTAIRQLGPVGLEVALRPCRINEELSGEGDFCSPCSQDFYSYGGAGGCKQCPEGAACSNRSLGGVLVPLDGYWHSSPLSANVIQCPHEGACQYEGRLEKLAEAQAAIIAFSTTGSNSSSGGGSSRSSANGSNGNSNGSSTGAVSRRRVLRAADSPDGIPRAATAPPPAFALFPAANAAASAGDIETQYLQLQCAEGYWGNACGSCLQGYGRQASGGCMRCRSLASRVGWVALAFFITFISVVAAVRAALTPEYLQVAAADARQHSRHAVTALSANTYNIVSTPAATPGGDALLPSPGAAGVGGLEEGGGGDGEAAAAVALAEDGKAPELGGAEARDGATSSAAPRTGRQGRKGDAQQDDAVLEEEEEAEEEEGVPLGQLSGERFAAALLRIHGDGARARRAAAGSSAGGGSSHGGSSPITAADLQPPQDRARTAGAATQAEPARAAAAAAAAAEATGAAAAGRAAAAAGPAATKPAAASQSGSELALAVPSSSSQSGSWHALFTLATPKSRLQLLKRPWERPAAALTAARTGRRSAPLSAEDVTEVIAVDVEAGDGPAAGAAVEGGGESRPGSQHFNAGAALAAVGASAVGSGRAGRRGGGGGGGDEGPTSQDGAGDSFAASTSGNNTASGQQHAPMLGMLPAYGKVSFASLLMAVRATKQPNAEGPAGAAGGADSESFRASRTSSGRPGSRSGSFRHVKASGAGEGDVEAGLSNSSSKRGASGDGGAQLRRITSRFAAATHAATAVHEMRRRAAATAAARNAGSGAGTDTGDDSAGPSGSATGRLRRQRGTDSDASSGTSAAVRASASKWHKRHASAVADGMGAGSGASEAHASDGASGSGSGPSGKVSPVRAAVATRSSSKSPMDLRKASPAGGVGSPPPPPRGRQAAGISAFAAAAKRFLKGGSHGPSGTGTGGAGSGPQSFTQAAGPRVAPGYQARHDSEPVQRAVDVQTKSATQHCATAGANATNATSAGADPTLVASDATRSMADATELPAASAAPTPAGKSEARSWGAAAAAALMLRGAASDSPLTPRASLQDAPAATGPPGGAGDPVVGRGPEDRLEVTVVAATAARGCSAAGDPAGGLGLGVDEEVGSTSAALPPHDEGPKLVSDAAEAAAPPAAAAPVVPTSAAAAATLAAPEPLPVLPPVLSMASATVPPHSALSGARRAAGASGGTGGPDGSRHGGGRMVSFAAGVVSPVSTSGGAARSPFGSGQAVGDVRGLSISRSSSSYSRQRSVQPPAALAIPTPSAHTPGAAGSGTGWGGSVPGMTPSRLRAASMPRCNDLVNAAVAASAAGAATAGAGTAAAAADLHAGHRLPPAALMTSRSFGGGRLRHRRNSCGGADDAGVWSPQPSAVATVAAAAAVALQRFEALPRSPAVLAAHGGTAHGARERGSGGGGGGGGVAPPPPPLSRMRQAAKLRIGIPSPPDRVTSLDRAAGSKYDPAWAAARNERPSRDRGSQGPKHSGERLPRVTSGSGALSSTAGSRCSGDGSGVYGSDGQPFANEHGDDDFELGDDSGSYGDHGGDGGGSDGDDGTQPDSTLRPGRSKVFGGFGGRQWRRRTDVISEHQTVFKILVSYVQVVSLVNNTPVTWPSVLVNYFNVASQASSATSSLASLDCSMSESAAGLPKSAQLFLIQVLAPAFWSAALVLFWLARAGWRLRRGRLQTGGPLRAYLHNRIIISVHCVIFVMYPSVVTQLFSLFSCMQLDAGPPQQVCPDPWRPDSCRWDRSSVGLFWTQDLEQRCYRGVHLTLCAAVGVPGVVLFAAGIPLMSAWWLWRNRASLWDEPFLALYGSLYQEYENEHYYWESVVMLRKLTVTAVIVFAGTYRWQLTLLLSMGVIGTSLLLQVAYRPYETDAMDELERLGLVATLLTFYLATYFMDDSVSRGVRVGLSFAILVINAATVFIMCVAIARELHRAALFRLLRISSARGDLPLYFVLRVGLLYGRWRGRVALTRLRTALYGASPRLFPMDFPPDADPVFVSIARSEAAAAADAVLAAAGRPRSASQRQPLSPGGAEAQVNGGAHGAAAAASAAAAAAAVAAAAAAAAPSPDVQRGASSRSLLVRRRALSASAQVLAAALRGAWEHHHHGAWLLRVFKLSERVSAAEEEAQRKKRRRRWSMWRGSDDEQEEEGEGNEREAGRGSWRQVPVKLVSRMSTAVRRLPTQLTRTASRLTRRFTHHTSDFMVMDAASSPPTGGAAGSTDTATASAAAGRSVRRRQQPYRQYGDDNRGAGGAVAAPYSPIEIVTPVAAFAPDEVISAAAAAVASGGSGVSSHMASHRRSSRTRPASGLLVSSENAAAAAAGGAGRPVAAATAAATAAPGSVTVGPNGVQLTTDRVALEPEPGQDGERREATAAAAAAVPPDGSHRGQRRSASLTEGGASAWAGAGGVGPQAGPVGDGADVDVSDGDGSDTDYLMLSPTWGPPRLLPEQR